MVSNKFENCLKWLNQMTMVWNVA